LSANPSAIGNEVPTGGRRGNNEGSTYQRSSDGRWLGVAVVGYNAQGRSIRKTVSAKTPAEVTHKLKRRSCFYGEPTFPSGNVTAVSATALAMWLALHPLLGTRARDVALVLGAAWTLLMSWPWSARSGTPRSTTSGRYCCPSASWREVLLSWTAATVARMHRMFIC